MEISRMPLSCPFLPGHYRTGVGKTKSKNFCNETVFAGHSRTHSDCYYVHKNWVRSSLTKSQHGAGREMEFSSGMWPLQGYPCSSRWSCTHAHTGNSKWTQSLLRERRGHIQEVERENTDINWERKVLWGIREELEERKRVNLIKTYSMGAWTPQYTNNWKKDGQNRSYLPRAKELNWLWLCFIYNGYMSTGFFPT